MPGEVFEVSELLAWDFVLEEATTSAAADLIVPHPDPHDSRNHGEYIARFTIMGTDETIEFKVHSIRIPMAELRTTFFEETRLNPSEYRLLVVDHAGFFEQCQNGHQGRGELASKIDTVHKILSKTNGIFDIDVVKMGSGLFDRRKKTLYHLNRLARKLSLKRAGENGLHVGPELLDHIMEFSDAQDLYSNAQVSTLWHTVAVRRSMLMQLAEGDFGWASEEGYPAFLSHIGDLEMRLTVATQGAAAADRSRLREVGFQKERNRGRNTLMYAKAMGCTRARTVTHACFKTSERSLYGFEHGFERPRPPSSLTRQVFFKKRKIQQFREEMHQNFVGLAPPKPNDVDSRIVQTRPSDGRLVAEAVDPNVLKKVINIFSRYFSPELGLIFPLICYRQNAMGLDFSSTRTWCVMDSDTQEKEVGAISWRIRRSASDKILQKMGITTDVEPVAEVLFIAVWEQLRSIRYGGDLVDAVAAEAVGQGVRLLYVEIGEEQPLAKDFWSKQGFLPLDRDTGMAGTTAELSEAQISFFDSVCFRFTDTRQWIRRL